MLKYINGNQAGELFRRTVKGRNALTPEILAYRGVKVAESPSNHIVYELSCSHDESQFGVTVVRNGEHHRDASQAFTTLGDAREYADKLIGKGVVYE